MITFQDIIEHIIKSEGGYVNDQDDSGGETKFGISKKANPDVDIRALTLDGAKEIYRLKYWEPSQAESLPTAIRFQYFDAYINHGPRRAGEILQEAIGRVKVDGAVGPKTIARTKEVCRQDTMGYNGLTMTQVVFSYRRLQLYTEIVVSNKSQRKFLNGWKNRIENNLELIRDYNS